MYASYLIQTLIIVLFWLRVASVTTRGVEAEAGSGSGGSGTFWLEAEAI